MSVTPNLCCNETEARSIHSPDNNNNRNTQQQYQSYWILNAARKVQNALKGQHTAHIVGKTEVLEDRHQKIIFEAEGGT